MLASLPSRKLTPSSRSNPCPVCSDISGDCRHGQDLILCHTYIDGGVYAPGYEFKKPDKTGVWGIYAPPKTNKDWLPKEVWIKQQQQLKAKRKADKRRQYQEALSADERDKDIREIAKVLGLKPEHQEDLKRRGLNNGQIEKGLFFSITPYASVPSDIPLNLPGIGHGHKILCSHSGYACVAFDHLGRAIGWQVRVDGAKDKSKYRWAKGLKSSHLKNGEMPITKTGDFESGIRLREIREKNNSQVERGISPAHLISEGQNIGQPQTRRISKESLGGNEKVRDKSAQDKYQENIQTINLCEGILKPYIAANKHGGIYLGSPNGNFSASPEQFKAAIAGAEEVAITPDAGDVLNTHVMTRWKNQIEWIQKQGLEVKIVWWGQVTKAEKDIDEIEPGTKIEYISATDFFNIAYREQKRDEDWQRWVKSRSLSAQLTQNQRFVEFPSTGDGQILFVKSGTGTGKTYQLLNKELKEHEGEGILIIGYLNSPLLQFCARSGTFYHLQSELKGTEFKGLIKDPKSNIALCEHSLGYFEPEDFDDRIVILDEIVSLVRSLLQDKNVRNPEQIKNLFMELLRRAKKVYCLDGHLNQETVNDIMSLAGDTKQAIVLENQFNSHRPKTKLIMGSYKNDGSIGEPDKGEIKGHILKNPGRFVVCSDSQKELEALDELLTSQGKKVLRLDSTQVGEDWVKEFLAETVNYIKKHKIDCLLYSPTGESALDIAIEGYFSDIYALFFGVLLTNQQLQLIARVRDSQAKLTISCPSRGLSKTSGDRKYAYTPEALDELVKEYILEAAYSALDGKAERNLTEKLLELRTQEVFHRMSLKLAAQFNYENNNLRDCLKFALTQSGYEVEEIITSSDKLATKQVAEAKDEILMGRAIAEYESPVIPIERAEEISRDIGATKEQKLQAKKALLLERLPGIQEEEYEADENEGGKQPAYSPEAIKKLRYDKPRTISQIDLRWLVQNIEEAKNLEQQKWFKRLEAYRDGENTHLDPISYHSKFLTAKTLIDIGIRHFLQPGQTWRNDSPEVIRFYEAAKKSSRKLGFSVGRLKKPVQFLGQTLARLGLKTSSQQIRENGNRLRQYSLKGDTTKLSGAILRCISRRYTEKIKGILPPDFSVFEVSHTPESGVCASQKVENIEKEKKSSNPLQSEDFSCHIPRENIYNNQGGMCHSELEFKDQEKEVSNYTSEEIEDAADILQTITKFEDFRDIFYPAGKLLEGFTSSLMRQATKSLGEVHQRLISQWVRDIKT